MPPQFESCPIVAGNEQPVQQKVIGVEFGRFDSGGGKSSPHINQINTFFGKAFARPMIKVDDDLKLLISSPPTATKPQQIQCDACDAHGHVQEDCPSFKLDENSLEWRFSKKRLDGHHRTTRSGHSGKSSISASLYERNCSQSEG
jgi:hypothetical protein